MTHNGSVLRCTIWTWLGAVALAGCGQGAATLEIKADAASVFWNAATTVDVLANDVASRGVVELIAVGTPAHGSARIDAGKLVYTPSAGYFGSDTVSYTARAVEGGIEASGSLTLAVSAQLSLKGLITDLPVANAVVSVTVGSTVFQTTANAKGAYNVAVTGLDPAAFVRISASGVGAQANVKLISLVPAFSALASAVDAQGQVASTAIPALDATHLSTAVAALLARANGGVMPSDGATLARLLPKINAIQVQRLAAVVRMVADFGLVLPSGTPDTLALLLDPAKTDALVAAQVANNSEQFAAVLASVAGDAPGLTNLSIAAAGEQTLVYEASNPSVTGSSVISYRPDGSATYRTGNSVASVNAEGRWSIQAGAIRIVFNRPVTTTTFSFDFDPITQNQNQILTEQTGVIIKHLASGSSTALATQANTGSANYTDGSRRGQAVAGIDWGVAGQVLRVHDVALRLPIDDADVTPGARWGGVKAERLSIIRASGSADVLRLDGAGKGRLEFGALDVDWGTADRWLSVTQPGLTLRYARLAPDDGRGFEMWLVTERVGGVDVDMAVVTLVMADAAPAFTATTAARDWRNEGSFEVGPESPAIINLYADLSARVFGSSNRANWSLLPSGVVELRRQSSSGAVTQTRRWTLLKKSGDSHFVLEDITGSVTAKRMVWYRDMGAAVK